MRILLVVPPLTGHVAPLRALAAALTDHEVAWCGPEPATTALTSGPVFPAGSSEPFDVDHRPAGLRGFAALRFLWQQYLIPLAEVMVPGVRSACDQFEPDLIVTDQQALAGALVAKERGIPWATSASTAAELTDPLRGLPKVAEWIRQLQQDLCSRHGVVPSDLRFSPELILAYTTKELTGPPSTAAVRYVGSIAVAESTVDFPALDGRPLVVATLGTANAQSGQRFLGECVEALKAMPEVQGVIVDPTGTLSNKDVLIKQRIPQVPLLQKASVVICHAGHNTVGESLAAGVPLVVAPIRDDQHTVAESVVAAGAGLRLRFDRARAEHIGRAVGTILATPDFTAAAGRLKQSLTTAGGAAAAVRHLEALVKGGRPCAPTPTRR